MLVIEQREEDVVLVLRHFDEGLVPWQSEADADGALEYRLVERAPGLAVFEDDSREEHDRLVYQRHGADLEVRLESSDGSPALVFEFSPRLQR